MENIQLEKHIKIQYLSGYGLKRKIVFSSLKVALMVFTLILRVMVSPLDLHQKIGNIYQTGHVVTVNYLFHALDLDIMMKW